MMHRGVILLQMVIAAALSDAVRADESALIRLADDGRSLQTAVRMYTHPARVSLALVGTVHVASAEYFARVQAMLPAFDSVLVEGIRRPSGTPVTVSHDYAPSLGLVQQTLSLSLSAPNVILADLDAAAYDRVRSQAVALPLMTPPARRALSDGLMTLATDAQALAAVQKAYAIRERDAVVINTLRQRLARGDSSIALLYGVAHGPDLHERLLKLGFTVQSTQWIDAFQVDAALNFE